MTRQDDKMMPDLPSITIELLFEDLARIEACRADHNDRLPAIAKRAGVPSLAEPYSLESFAEMLLQRGLETYERQRTERDKVTR